MTQERDTHFVSFAKLLWDELEDLRDNMEPDFSYQSYERFAQKFIARGAYDLLVHDRLHTATSDLQHAASQLEAEEMVNGVPDMMAWPDQSE